MIKRTQHQTINRKDHNHYFQLKIQLYFILMAVILCSFFFMSGKLRFGDLFFNYFRFREVGLDLLHGQFPQFNFFTGTILGGATSTFYPWLTMVPFLPLMHFLSPLSWWAFIIGFGFVMGLEIAYFTSRTINWTRQDSFIFANFYVLSLIAVDYVYYGNDIGGFYSMMLAPLVFFGWWHWIKSGRWRMMLIGLLLICYTHLITVIVFGVMLSLLTVAFINHLRWSKLTTLVKTFLLFIGCTTVLWLPMLILLHANRIYTPSEFSMPWLQRPLFIKPLSAYLNFYSDNSFGIVDGLALLFVLLTWRWISNTDKKFAGVSLIFIIMNLQPVAKWLVVKTPFSNFQFMHRFCFCSHLLLSVVLVDVIRVLVKQWSFRSLHLLVRGTIAFMILMMIGAGSLYLIENNQKPLARVTSIQSAQPVLRQGGSSVVTTRNLEKPIFWHVLMNTYSDYYPQSDVKIIHANHMIVPQVRMPMLSHTGYTSNGDLVETVPRTKTYTLPMVAYHQQNYSLMINGRPQKLRTNRQYIKVHLRPGRNVIHLGTPVMWYRYLAILISLLSLIQLIRRSMQNN